MLIIIERESMKGYKSLYNAAYKKYEATKKKKKVHVAS